MIWAARYITIQKQGDEGHSDNAQDKHDDHANFSGFGPLDVFSHESTNVISEIEEYKTTDRDEIVSIIQLPKVV